MWAELTGEVAASPPAIPEAEPIPMWSDDTGGRRSLDRRYHIDRPAHGSQVTRRPHRPAGEVPEHMGRLRAVVGRFAEARLAIKRQASNWQ